jgi:hypothetical protein
MAILLLWEIDDHALVFLASTTEGRLSGWFGHAVDGVPNQQVGIVPQAVIPRKRRSRR